jgi:hypothetical protein
MLRTNEVQRYAVDTAGTQAFRRVSVGPTPQLLPLELRV